MLIEDLCKKSGEEVPAGLLDGPAKFFNTKIANKIKKIDGYTNVMAVPLFYLRLAEILFELLESTSNMAQLLEE